MFYSVNIPQFIHSTVDGHLDSFQFGLITKSAMMNSVLCLILGESYWKISCRYSFLSTPITTASVQALKNFHWDY